MNLLETIRGLRVDNAAALHYVLKTENTFSESSLHAAWLERLASLTSISSTGWYLPPPGGATVLIGDAPNYDRIRFHSLRDEEKWPNAKISFRPDSLIYAYASPVGVENYLLGDMAVSLCRTQSSTLQKYISQIFSITLEVARSTNEGMRFCEVYQNAIKLFDAAGFNNYVYSKTDPCNSDIGHTVPWSYDGGPSSSEFSILKNGSAASIASLISSKRIFLNKESTLEIKSPIAFTIEPRLGRNGLPPLGFHLTIVFEKGCRFIVAGFKPLLEFFEMTSWLPAKDLEILDAV